MKNDTLGFRWKCNHEHISPAHKITTRCYAKSRTSFLTASDAAAAGLRAHGKQHKNDIVVLGEIVIGSAVGLNFNQTKS